MITLPFRNNMGKVRISGLDIHRAIEHAFKKYNPLKPRGVFLQVSGERLLYIMPIKFSLQINKL